MLNFLPSVYVCLFKAFSKRVSGEKEKHASLTLMCFTPQLTSLCGRKGSHEISKIYKNNKTQEMALVRQVVRSDVSNIMFLYSISLRQHSTQWYLVTSDTSQGLKD